MITTLLHLAMAIVLREPTDSPVYPIDLRKTDTGHAVAFYWTPAPSQSPTHGFRFWASSDPFTVRSWYVGTNYQDVRLGLSIQRGHYVLARHQGRDPRLWRRVSFATGRRYHFLAFWRRVGDKLEMGVYLDGRLVSHHLAPRGQEFGLWPSLLRVGSRDGRRGNPERHTAEGAIQGFTVLALRGGAVRRVR